MKTIEQRIAALEQAVGIKPKATITIDPELVLNGSDLNYDVHELVTYVWHLSQNSTEFPETHMAELIQVFLEKHNTTQKSDAV